MKYNNELLAINIYEATLDMDYADFEDTRDEETDYIRQALDEIESLSADSVKFTSLYNALGMIFERG
jgi:hypothetical protein